MRLSIRQSEKYRKSFVFHANEWREIERVSHYGCRILIRFVWFRLPPSRSTQFINENVFAPMHFTATARTWLQPTGAHSLIRSATKMQCHSEETLCSGKSETEKNKSVIALFCYSLRLPQQWKATRSGYLHMMNVRHAKCTRSHTLDKHPTI